MKISLEKGGSISLSKTDDGLKKVLFGAGWDLNEGAGANFDLDISAVLRTGSEIANPQHFVFYNNLKSPCESVALSGDNQTGDGEGDDESISVDLEKIPNDIESILFAISIHEADERNQNFGQVKNSFVHLQNQATGKEIVSYNLAEEFSNETLIIVGEIVKKSGEWIFEAKAEGWAGGLKGFLKEMGLEVA